MLLTERSGQPSAIGFHVFPESVVFQTPPLDEPAYQMAALDRSNATALMRPVVGKHPTGADEFEMLIGPTKFQNAPLSFSTCALREPVLMMGWRMGAVFIATMCCSVSARVAESVGRTLVRKGG